MRATQPKNTARKKKKMSEKFPTILGLRSPPVIQKRFQPKKGYTLMRHLRDISRAC